MLDRVPREPTSTRRKQLLWVRAVLDHTHWSVNRLAQEAGVSQSTIAKFLNDPDNAATLNSNSVDKIARVSPIAPYNTEPVLQMRGLSEHEAEPFTGYPGDEYIESAINAMKLRRNSVDPWTIRSRALELAGYLPGDVVMVDLNMQPKEGDVVCAQIYDRSGKAETVFRIFERPFLVAATNDRGHFKPQIVDNDLIAVLGVVVASVRPRLSLLAS